MKKFKRLKVVFSVLLAMIVLLCASLAVHAEAPTNPYWSGTTACWTPASDSGVGYVLTLYKNGSQVSSFLTTSAAVDMSGGMSMNGAGDYTFSVCVSYGDGSFSTGVYSGTYSYVPSHTHTMNHIYFQYPDCTTEGIKEHYECSGCGKWFWDNLGEYEITDHSDVALPAMGHHWGEWKVVQKPTKTEKGIEMRTCYENPDHAEYRDIPALGEDKSTTAPNKATEKPTEKSTDKATEKSTEKSTETASEKSTEKKPLPTVPKNPFSSSQNSPFPWLMIGAIALIVLGIVIIIFVIALRKRSGSKQRPQPPLPPDPPTQPNPGDSFGDHFDRMQ